MSLTRFISETLPRPDEAMNYEFSRHLAELYPDRYLLETEDYDFDLDAFIRDLRCHAELRRDAHVESEAIWAYSGQDVTVKARQGFIDVDWNGERFNILRITYGECNTTRHFILASTAAAAWALFRAVCTWSTEVRGEILVFRAGQWQKDENLLNAIQSTSLDNLILEPGLKERIVSDVADFFAGAETYDRYGIAWKRGMLLLGSPGNGKTHTVKAIVNHVQKPCLYVRSFKAYRKTPHQNIEAVFERARKTAPCFLLFEDLDSLIDENTRAYFLNEMDGFASNRGILTIASTNHPEKLDSAITQRPSRFDRKYAFPLPASAERERYLALATGSWEEGIRPADEELRSVVEMTEGFSFAFLKELCLSGLMAWMGCRDGRIADQLVEQARSMRSQIGKPVTVPEVEDGEEDDDD